MAGLFVRGLSPIFDTHDVKIQCLMAISLNAFKGGKVEH